MHSPLCMHDAAHLRDASGPSPVRRMSRMPPMMSLELTSTIPAGVTLGQTSTHLPHRVQASSISSTRAPSAVSKEVSLIGYRSCLYPMRTIQTAHGLDVVPWSLVLGP